MTSLTPDSDVPLDVNVRLYNEQAEQLAAQYNSRATAEIMPTLASIIQAVPDKAHFRVVDLGCGSGRDAFWLAQQGVPVVACDGAVGMLDQARQQHAHPAIKYVQDSAPALQLLRQKGMCFDLVLMSAFLFHFDAPERQILYGHLKTMMRPQARAFITLRHGPVPEGRVMYQVPHQELQDFAVSLGGQLQDHGQKQDPMNRPDVRWDHLTLQF